MNTTLPAAPRSVSLVTDIILARNSDDRMKCVTAYRSHVNRMTLLGGHYGPLVMHIKDEVENRGHRWNKSKHALALVAGAI